MSKKIIVIRQEPLVNNIVLVRENILKLGKLNGRHLELLFLIMRECLEYNVQTFEITKKFREIAEQEIGLKNNNFNINMLHITRAKVLKSIKRSRYVYNPHLFYYADDEVAKEWLYNNYSTYFL